MEAAQPVVVKMRARSAWAAASGSGSALRSAKHSSTETPITCGVVANTARYIISAISSYLTNSYGITTRDLQSSCALLPHMPLRTPYARAA